MKIWKNKFGKDKFLVGILFLFRFCFLVVLVSLSSIDDYKILYHLVMANP